MTSFECEKCLSDILSGKVCGLQQIYGEYHYAVFAFALSILKNFHSAEDVTQEVFIRIWKNVNTYKFGSNPYAWIMQITRNLCLDVFRKTKHEILDESDGASSVNSGVLNDESISDNIMLQQALRLLPDPDRQIFIMHIVGDIPYVSISRILKIPLSTVAFKCSRSVKKVREFLQGSI